MRKVFPYTNISKHKVETSRNISTTIKKVSVTLAACDIRVITLQFYAGSGLDPYKLGLHHA